jgi:hypothetical protein
VLVNLWQYNDGFVRSAVRRAGYEIEIKDKGVQLREIHRPYAMDQWMKWLWLGLFWVLGWIVRRYRMNQK